MKTSEDWLDYSRVKSIVIGIIDGDGIGSIITKEAHNLLKHLLEDEIATGKVEIRTIGGLTIENRAKERKTVPDDVLIEIRKCHVILKGPTTTPNESDSFLN